MALEQWFTIDLPALLEMIEPRNIINADETGLFWRNVGVKSLVIGKQQEKGVKIAKDRITILLACSGAGEKFAPCIVGTSAQPRAFTANAVHDITVETYGFSYYHNTTAWMTGEFFNSWLDWLNNEMKKADDRHVVLLVDNFTGHNVSYRSNVEVRFLPPNCTAKAQPLDAGIIKCFKDSFKKHLYKRVFERIHEVTGVEDFLKELTIFNAADWTLEAWKSVKESTIVNCFYKCRIVQEKWQDDEVLLPAVVGSKNSSACSVVQDLVSFDDDEF